MPLPTADEAFNALPTPEAAFGPDPASQLAKGPYSGSFSDYFFSQGPVNRVLGAFAQGAKDGYGAVQTDPDEKVQQDLQSQGLDKDYNDHKGSVLKASNEAWMRSAAYNLYNAPLFGGLSAAGVVGGASAGLGGAAKATGQVGGELMNAAESVKGVPYIGKPLSTVVGGTGEIIAGASEGALFPETFHPIDTARSNAAIGESESHFFGTVEPNEAQVRARAEATANLVQDNTVRPDVHQRARELAPSQFNEYDSVQGQKDVLEPQIEAQEQARLESPEVQEAQKSVDTILDSVNHNEEELSDRRADELSEARNKLDSLLNTDTPEMAQNREYLSSINNQLNNLSPDIREAYSQAADQLGTDLHTAPQELTEGVPGPDGTTIAPVRKTVDELSQGTIAQDVTQKLIEAGRPAEEAKAAGVLWQQRFETRSGQSPHLGTPEEIYQKTGADILSGHVTKTTEGQIFKGAIRRGTRGMLVKGDPRNVIRLFETADSSTVFHETGHQWLEELMSDSAHPEASEGLKADAQAARDYLGNKGEPLTRGQHEKFARSFERYLREGHAPTQELAGIFGKFKQWLSRVYKTLKDLPNSKINDSIRSVFDNLIVNDKDRTVIAPEPAEALRGSPEVVSQRGKMSDIERAEAISNFRRQVQDRAQMKAVSREAPGDVKNPLDDLTSEGWKPPESTGEAKETVSDKGTFKTDSTPLVSKAGNIDVSNLHSDKDLTKALQDFYEIHKEDLDVSRGKISDQDKIDLIESGGISKYALNMQALQKAAEDGGIPLSAYVRGLRKVYLDSAKAIKEIVDGNDAVAYAEAVDRHLALTKKLMGITAEWGRTGQAFRSLSEEAKQADNLTELLQSTIGKSLPQVKAEMKAAALLDTPEKLSKFVQDSDKPSFGEMMLEFYRNTLISGPITHMTYAAGNKVYALYKAVPETLAKAAVGFVHEKIVSGTIKENLAKDIVRNEGINDPERYAARVKEVASGISDSEVTKHFERVRAGEAREGAYAMLFGQWDGLKAAGRSFKVGQTIGLPGEGSVADLAIKRAISEGKTPGTTEFADRVEVFKQRIAEEVASRENITDDDKLVTRAEELKKSTDPVDHRYATPFTNTKAIPNIKKLGVAPSSIPIIGGKDIHALPLGTILRFPGERMVAPIHSFDRTVGYLTNRAQLIYRQAASEGLSGDSLSKRIAELEHDTPDMITYQARQEATEQALMVKAGDFTKRIKAVTTTEIKPPLIGRMQPLSFIAPFANVIANVDRGAYIDRTPLGILSSRVRDDMSGKNGVLAQDTTIAKIGLGTAVLGAVAAGVSLRYFNGPAPDKPNEAKVHQAVNGLPYSARIGEMSYAMEKLGIPGKILTIGMNLGAAKEEFHKTGDFALASLHFLNHTGKDLIEGPMSNLGSLLEAVEDSGRYGKSFVENFLSSAVPYSVGSAQVTKLTDPYQRDAEDPDFINGLLKSMQSKVPLISEHLQSKVDLLGAPVPNKEYWGVYAQQISNDPVWKALDGTGFYPAPVKRTINNVQLSDKQYHDYATMSGTLSRAILSPIVSSDKWPQLSFYTRHEIVKTAFEEGRKAAGAAVSAQSANQSDPEYSPDHDIISKSNQSKIDAVTATGPVK